MDIDSTYIGPHVKIGPGVTVEPGTIILGFSDIGAGTTVGPNTRIESCKIGRDCRVYMSHLRGATLGEGVKCGPFANIRPDSVLDDHVKVGNYVEVKNSHLGADVSVGHLAYVGDAEVGENTNIGAGAVTCNYDGHTKHRTTIGSEVFIGSNTTLIAPVKIEHGAIVAAGSTITSDVPAAAGAFGRARQENKPGWAAKWRMKIGSSK
jgi:bifunctional UDP-N-acetylglucosamine pyrophosphorylase/glucosamine-1-phosphate N-acetyltransferase